MRRIVLGTIRIFGRYTAIIIFVAVCILGAVWLNLLDSYPVAVLVSAIVVVPLFIASFALLVGLFFSGLAAQDGERLSRKDAPELWGIWDEFDQQSRSDRHLIIDGDMNASIGERRKIAGLWGHEVTMRIGLPLMLCLDVPALRAVIAHEVGHNQLKHTSGLANLVEFERTFEALFDFADPNETVTGAVAYVLLGRFGSWLHQEVLRLSRRNEFEADRIAATREGVSAEARSMVLVEAAAEFYEEDILEGIQKELVGATKAPLSPLKQLIARLDEFRNPENIHRIAERCWNKDPDPDSTHPPLKERLGAHGVEEIPSIESIDPPAADVLLAPDTKSRLKKQLDDEWTEDIDAMVRLE